MAAILVSVNIGLPRELDWNGKTVVSGIFKEPVTGPVMARTLNIDGDRQADLAVHGGAHKAVYAFPSEHYEFWRRELPGAPLPWGMFGENFTVHGLLETDVQIGDRYRIGAAEVSVTQPRLPCYKLGMKFHDPHMVKRFLASGRVGFYFAVAREGMVAAGDGIELLSREAGSVTIADITRFYVAEKHDAATLQHLVQLKGLSDAWRGHFQRRLQATGHHAR